MFLVRKMMASEAARGGAAYSGFGLSLGAAGEQVTVHSGEGRFHTPP